MLSFIFFLLILSIVVLFFLNDVRYLRFYSLLFSSIIFIYSVKLLLLFDCSNYYFQNIIRYLNHLNIGRVTTENLINNATKTRTKN